tara:strand:+ start:14967 stop:15806 length:840 start_codon:yes stop_codon:yes gene_type:complete
MRAERFSFVEAAETAPPPDVVRDWRRDTALVLDSNTFMRNIIVNILRDAGARNIVSTSHTDYALDALRDSTPGLIICDWSEQEDPREDRLNWLRRVRGTSRASFRDTPAILVSRPRTRSEVEHARDAGASEFVVTPLAPTTLVSRADSLQSQPRSFIDVTRFQGPNRRRRPRPPMTQALKRGVDVAAGLTTPIAAARAGALAFAEETFRSGDPLAMRVARSLQRFIASIREFTVVEAEVVEMHRAALAQLVRMSGAGDPLRGPVVTGLEQLVAKRMGQR